MSRRLRRVYGAGPLHLLALLASFAIAGAAVVRWLDAGPDAVNIALVVRWARCSDTTSCSCPSTPGSTGSPPGWCALRSRSTGRRRTQTLRAAAVTCAPRGARPTCASPRC